MTKSKHYKMIKKGKQHMKNFICSILYTAVIAGSSIAFTLNGFGIDTWQWWLQFTCIFVSHILGLLRAVDFE